MARYEVEQMESWADYIDAPTHEQAALSVAKSYHGVDATVKPLPENEGKPRHWFDVYDGDVYDGMGSLVDTYIVTEKK